MFLYTIITIYLLDDSKRCDMMIVVIRRQRKERKTVVVSAVVVTVMKMSGKRRAVLGESITHTLSILSVSFSPRSNRFPFFHFPLILSFLFHALALVIHSILSVCLSFFLYNNGAMSLTAISLKIHLRTCMYTHTCGSIVCTCYVYTSIGICICKYLYI